MDFKLHEKDFFQLINIGIALTREHEINKLLTMIVRDARKFTHCDAGSLYIVEENQLIFVVAQNDTLDKIIGSDGRTASFKPFPLPLNTKSLAGYVAITGESLKIDDVYLLSKNKDYKFNKDFDKRTNYRTQSMLVLPLCDSDNNILGVLQLINALDENDNVIPFDPFYVRFVKCLASQASVAINNAKLNIELKKAHLNTIIQLSIAGEYRDDSTGKHVKRISEISEIISNHLELTDKTDFIEMIKYSSLMHDIGKIAIPDNILLKPGKLTPEERIIMEQHTIKGARILDKPSIHVLNAAKEVALNHHEKFDGTGYPNKIAGKDIPISGRIVALADVFDALSNKRCYKPAFEIDKVINIIKEERGKHFDPDIVDAFFEGFDEIMKIHDTYKE